MAEYDLYKEQTLPIRKLSDDEAMQVFRTMQIMTCPMTELAPNCFEVKVEIDVAGIYVPILPKWKNNHYLWFKEYPQFNDVTREQLQDVKLIISDDLRKGILRWESLGIEIDTADIKPMWRPEVMFFLTRDGDIEITSYGFPEINAGLYYYGGQCLRNYGTKPDDPEFDEFGRNRIDRQFVLLCMDVIWLLMDNNGATFISLSCKKADDKYIVRLQLTDETLEAELLEMIQLVEKRRKEKISKTND